MKEWQGTDEEQLALLRAVKNWCGCDIAMGYTVTQRGCHELLIPPTDKDPNKWNRLIFMHRQAGRLMVEELGPQRRVKPGATYTSKDINLIHQLGK